MTGKTYNFTPISQYYWIIGELGKNIKKTNIKNDVCSYILKRVRLKLVFLYTRSYLRLPLRVRWFPVLRKQNFQALNKDVFQALYSQPKISKKTVSQLQKIDKLFLWYFTQSHFRLEPMNLLSRQWVCRHVLRKESYLGWHISSSSYVVWD